MSPATAPIDTIPLKGTNPTGQTGEAEITVGPGWLAHVDATRIKVKVRDAQRVTVLHSPPAPDKIPQPLEPIHPIPMAHSADCKRDEKSFPA